MYGQHSVEEMRRQRYAQALQGLTRAGATAGSEVTAFDERQKRQAQIEADQQMRRQQLKDEEHHRGWTRSRTEKRDEVDDRNRDQDYDLNKTRTDAYIEDRLVGRDQERTRFVRGEERALRVEGERRAGPLYEGLARELASLDPQSVEELGGPDGALRAYADKATKSLAGSGMAIDSAQSEARLWKARDDMARLDAEARRRDEDLRARNRPRSGGSGRAPGKEGGSLKDDLAELSKLRKSEEAAIGRAKTQLSSVTRAIQQVKNREEIKKGDPLFRNFGGLSLDQLEDHRQNLEEEIARTNPAKTYGERRRLRELGVSLQDILDPPPDYGEDYEDPDDSAPVEEDHGFAMGDPVITDEQKQEPTRWEKFKNFFSGAPEAPPQQQAKPPPAEPSQEEMALVKAAYRDLDPKTKAAVDMLGETLETSLGFSRDKALQTAFSRIVR